MCTGAGVPIIIAEPMGVTLIGVGYRVCLQMSDRYGDSGL